MGLFKNLVSAAQGPIFLEVLEGNWVLSSKKNGAVFRAMPVYTRLGEFPEFLFAVSSNGETRHYGKGLGSSIMRFQDAIITSAAARVPGGEQLAKELASGVRDFSELPELARRECDRLRYKWLELGQMVQLPPGAKLDRFLE